MTILMLYTVLQQQKMRKTTNKTKEYLKCTTVLSLL